jgi:hypothetical protein
MRNISAFSASPKTYRLVWKNEVIEENLEHEEALYLLGEYNLAYGGGVTLEED